KKPQPQHLLQTTILLQRQQRPPSRRQSRDTAAANTSSDQPLRHRLFLSRRRSPSLTAGRTVSLALSSARKRKPSCSVIRPLLRHPRRPTATTAIWLRLIEGSHSYRLVLSFLSFFRVES
ncbi:hypothetical protein V8G54_003998, partial [Vigna mungo]